MAAAIGADCRIEPSPKYWICPSSLSGMAGKTKGIADEAIRCVRVMRSCTARRSERVGPVNLLRMNIFPDPGDAPHGAVEIIGTTGQRSGIDGTRRSASDDRKGVGLVHCAGCLSDVGNRLQHADLVSGTGAAAGEQEGVCRSWGWRGRSSVWHASIIGLRQQG